MKKDNLEIVLGDISGKFELVLEGHAALDKKIDSRFDQLDQKIELVDFKVEALNQKIDAVAADLKAHREDTEAHPGIYHVGEK